MVPTGLPLITSPITIDGNFSTDSPALERAEFRILAVGPTGNLTLQFTTVSDGASGGGHGGGIDNAGTLTLLDSTVSQQYRVELLRMLGWRHRKQRHAHTDQQRRLGQYGRLRRRHRELRHRNTDRQLLLSRNTADVGGGIRNFFGTVTSINSIVGGNTAVADGGIVGAPYPDRQDPSRAMTAAGGSAGGIRGGPLTLTNSTVSGIPRLTVGAAS